MGIIWTLSGDETSWPEWASRMASSPSSDLANSLLTDLHVDSPAWALDLGCGTGRAFPALHNNGYKIIGVDPVYAAAQASLTRAKAENLCAWPVLAIANPLPLQSHSIQLTLAFGVLFHLGPGELDHALQEIQRVLAPDGTAILHFLDIDDWRRNLGVPIETSALPFPSYRAIVTCFCSSAVIQEKILSSGLKIEGHELKTSKDEPGERKEWIFYCTR